MRFATAEQLDKWLNSVERQELLRRIKQFHSTVKFFPVSSVGLRLSYGSVQKSVFYDEKLVLRVTNVGTPVNIIEPFIWIFERLRESA